MSTNTTVKASNTEVSSRANATQARSPFRFTKATLNLHQTVNSQLKQSKVFCNDGIHNYTLKPSGVKTEQAQHYANADITYEDIFAGRDIYTFVAVNATNNYPLCVVQYSDGTINMFWGKQLNSLTRTIIENPKSLKPGHI